MNKNVVLFDMNNLAMRAVHINGVKTVDPNTKTISDINWSYWKFIMFSNIYQSLYKVPTKTIVLAIDSRNSWRYTVWPRYKEARKKKNKENKDLFPWETFYKEYDEFAIELQEHFPIKVLQIEGAEADDIIGVISRQIDDPVEIISTDKDFLQLSCERVKIYNPLLKTHVSHPSPSMFLIEECMMGQAKDSIFNIKTPLDWPDDKKKPGFGPSAFEKVMIYGVKKWLQDNNLSERFLFNKKLMDFSEIPQNLQNVIMADYTEYKYPDPSMMWEYVKKYEWPEVIDKFTQIEDKFLQLY